MQGNVKLKSGAVIIYVDVYVCMCVCAESRSTRILSILNWSLVQKSLGTHSYSSTDCLRQSNDFEFCWISISFYFYSSHYNLSLFAFHIIVAACICAVPVKLSPLFFLNSCLARTHSATVSCSSLLTLHPLPLTFSLMTKAEYFTPTF